MCLRGGIAIVGGCCVACAFSMFQSGCFKRGELQFSQCVVAISTMCYRCCCSRAGSDVQLGCMSFETAHLVSFHGVFARCKDPPGGLSSCVTLHDSHGVDVSCFTIFHDAWFVVFHATMCGDIKSRCQDANGAICRRHFRRDIFPKTPLLWMEVVKSVILSNDMQECN